MFKKIEFLIAFRYLKSKKKEKALSIIANFSLAGIMLGVAAIIVVMSVMNGFRDELVKRILGINGHVNIYSYDGGFPDYKSELQKIKSIITEKKSELSSMEITGIQPVISTQVMVSSNRYATGALLKGVDFNILANEEMVNQKLSGKAVKYFNDGEIAIGYSLARKLRVGIGDEITLTAPTGKITAFGTMPSIRVFRIASVFNIGMHEYDSSLIFIPIESLAKFIGAKNTHADFFEIYTTRPEAAEKLKSVLLEKRANENRILTWQEINSSFYGALKVERNVMFLILTLIVLVASFNIVSSLVILVKNKSRDIAILKTMGASKSSIVRIFFIAGATLGAAGTLMGVGLGIIISKNLDAIKNILNKLTGADVFAKEIYFLSNLPSRIDYFDVAIITATALSISFIATIFPAKKAGKTDPVEALRYE
ncbi:MAG: lipoprotein-releasing ABC transporter permease subunit [Rickettsiales bacterium]|jgi:lipoprotein-releasing system permease protein|nr:lipoprotein-releasing ABC transporter permease subunit [Rickettsiales bacterium]